MTEPVSLPPGTIIRFDDCRRAGYCLVGVKRWFERNGGDFDAFVANGMTVEQALSWMPDDGLLHRVMRFMASEV